MGADIASPGPSATTMFAGPALPAGLDPEAALRMYRTALLARRLDERIWTLNRQGRAAFAVSCQGHEGAQVGSAFALAADDVALPYYRDTGVVLARGMTAAEILMGVLARAGDPSSGARQMPNHWGCARLGIVTGSSPIATQLPHATGIAYARRLQGRDDVCVVWFGDGATSEGDFHEAMNFAGIHKLGVVFVCENNGYAISVPLAKESAVADMARRGESYAFPGVCVDGQDAFAVYAATRDAVERARRGDGPTLIEAKTYRYQPHTSDDDDRAYRSAAEVAAWRRRDPLTVLRDQLVVRGLLPLALQEEYEREVAAELATALAEAEASPSPEPASAYTRVYAAPLRAECPGDPAPAIDRSPVPSPPADCPEVNLLTAIHDTLAAAADADPRIVVLGEDVGARGGVFGATGGLQAAFGEQRVLDTPLAESQIVGAAIGMALDGLRPVAEIQFLDFVHPALDQLLNEAAKIHYRSNGDFRVPLVVRMPYGGGVHGALYHSQSIEALFCHVPGLKVVAPSTPADAAGLLRAALADPDPVIFLEHKKAYRAIRGQVAPGEWCVPIGVGDVVRSGTDVTIATYGMMRHYCVAAAHELDADGISVEVIDLRTLYPLDVELVVESVSRTGRLLVVHEANRTGGIGAELCAEVTERAFARLDAPVRRLAAADVPALPFAASLEREILFGPERIVAAVRDLVRY